MNTAAFLSFITMTCITPGPNNITAMAMARKYGLRNSMKCIFGYFIGYLFVMAAAWLFSAVLYELIPTVKPYMLALGSCYILWLSWHILSDESAAGGEAAADETAARNKSVEAVNPPDESGAGDITAGKAPAANDRDTPSTGAFIRQSLLLMLFNVKVLIYAITVWSSFLLPSDCGTGKLIGFYIFLCIFGPFNSAVWAACGAYMDRLFSKHGRVLNAVMALALVWCAWSMVSELF